MSDAAENPRAVIGDNAPTPFDLSSNTVEALREEARHWLDGAKITSQDEADAVGRLLSLAREARTFADGHRAAEKKPYDDKGKAVQARYRPLIMHAELIATVCKDALTPWLAAQAAEQERIAEEARQKADAKAQAAREAVRSASGLVEREEAEAKLREARRLETDASRLSREKAQATGGDRAIGLRTSYRAEVTDYTALARFAWDRHSDELCDWLAALAQRLVKQGQRDIPGVSIKETRHAA